MKVEVAEIMEMLDIATVLDPHSIPPSALSVLDTQNELDSS